MVSMQRERRNFTGLANGAEIRSATFDGDDYIVVPVIALVGNTVVCPINAEGPEFVPASELETVPGGWDGRPVLPDHPNDGQSSANVPRTLEEKQFGILFNTQFSDNKLKTEAWLSKERAENVGDDAVSVITRIENGEMVEVSVGAWISAEKVTGEFEGKAYEFIWRDIVPDHLAMLPEGTEGACSIEMGAGAPRVNRKVLRAAEGKMPKLLNSILTALGLRSLAEHLSDTELRNKLWEALRAVEPGFEFVDEVFPDTLVVVYAVWPEDKLLWFRRSFTLDDAGAVELNDDREEVAPVTRFEPLSDEEGNSNTNDIDVGDKPTVTGRTTQGETMSNVSELVARLIATETFSEDDKVHLEGLGEETLTAIEEAFNDVKPDGDGGGVITEESTETKPVETSPEKTEEEWLGEAPESLRAMINRWQTKETRRREHLVSSLSGAQDSFTESQLKDKDTEELEALSSMLKLEQPSHDYTGRLVPTTKADVVEEPKGYTKALEKRLESQRAN